MGQDQDRGTPIPTQRSREAAQPIPSVSNAPLLPLWSSCLLFPWGRERLEPGPSLGHPPPLLSFCWGCLSRGLATETSRALLKLEACPVLTEHPCLWQGISAAPGEGSEGLGAGGAELQQGCHHQRLHQAGLHWAVPWCAPGPHVPIPCQQGEELGTMLGMLCMPRAHGGVTHPLPGSPSVSLETETAGPRTEPFKGVVPQGQVPFPTLWLRKVPLPAHSYPRSCWLALPLPGCPEHGDKVLGCGAPGQGDLVHSHPSWLGEDRHGNREGTGLCRGGSARPLLCLQLSGTLGCCAML